MRIIIVILLLLTSMSGVAQRFSTYVGIGIGGNFEKKFPGCSKKSNGRIAGYIAPYYQISDRFSIGIEAITSGNILRILGGSGGGCNTYNATTNTQEESYNNLSAGTFLIRNKLSFPGERAWIPYVDLGFGINTYSGNIYVDDETNVRKSTFVISPEAGFNLSKFQFSCKIILGSKTPAFNGFSSFSNMNYILQSINSQQLYLTAAYRLFRF